MADPKLPFGEDALDALSQRVAKVRADTLGREPKAAIDRSGMSLGLRMASEFASAILVGGLLGYGVDFLAKSSPWALFVGLGIGFAAGTVNLVRVSRNYASAHPVDPNAPALVDDDKDA